MHVHRDAAGFGVIAGLIDHRQLERPRPIAKTTRVDAGQRPAKNRPAPVSQIGKAAGGVCARRELHLVEVKCIMRRRANQAKDAADRGAVPRRSDGAALVTERVRPLWAPPAQLAVVGVAVGGSGVKAVIVGSIVAVMVGGGGDGVIVSVGVADGVTGSGVFVGTICRENSGGRSSVGAGSAAAAALGSVLLAK